LLGLHRHRTVCGFDPAKRECERMVCILLARQRELGNGLRT
jgi:hypothetical protein